MLRNATDILSDLVPATVNRNYNFENFRLKKLILFLMIFCTVRMVRKSRCLVVSLANRFQSEGA